MEAFNVFSNVFAAVNKEKPALGAVVGQPANRNLEIVVVCSTGDVYTQTYSETSLKEAKGEKTSWGSLFKQLKHQLKKSSIKGATGGPSIKLSIPADGKNSTTLELTLKSEGSNFTAAHRALLTPMAAAFHKFKAGDDSKFVKIETDGNAVKASKADSSQKIASLQTEIEPLSKSAKQAQDDARAAREQCDGIRKNMNKLRNSLEYKGRDFLYPDGPATYTLHLPQGKEHRPGRVPANEVVMASIREKYGGDPSVVMGEGAKTNAEEINSILEKIDEWDFDVFALQKATNNSPLFSVCYRLLYQYGLVQHFNIDHTVLVNFLQVCLSQPFKRDIFLISQQFCRTRCLLYALPAARASTVFSETARSVLSETARSALVSHSPLSLQSIGSAADFVVTPYTGSGKRVPPEPVPQQYSRRRRRPDFPLHHAPRQGQHEECHQND